MKGVRKPVRLWSPGFLRSPPRGSRRGPDVSIELPLEYTTSSVLVQSLALRVCIWTVALPGQSSLALNLKFARDVHHHLSVYSPHASVPHIANASSDGLKPGRQPAQSNMFATAAYPAELQQQKWLADVIAVPSSKHSGFGSPNSARLFPKSCKSKVDSHA